MAIVVAFEIFPSLKTTPKATRLTIMLMEKRISVAIRKLVSILYLS
jgi:hypothetical protein